MRKVGLLDAAVNIAHAAGKAVIAFKNGEPIIADNPTHERRLILCRDCEFIDGNKCSECGCFTTLKAHLETETCPKKKW